MKNVCTKDYILIKTKYENFPQIDMYGKLIIRWMIFAIQYIVSYKMELKRKMGFMSKAFMFWKLKSCNLILGPWTLTWQNYYSYVTFLHSLQVVVANTKKDGNERGPRSHQLNSFLRATTPTTSLSSTGCLLWLSCGWTSTEIIFAFTFVTNF
jgi:hypothetical protein